MTEIHSRKAAILKTLAGLHAFTFCGTQGLLVPLYPYIAERLQIGFATFLGCFSLGSLLFIGGSPYWAHRSDQWGRERVLRMGMLSLFISFGILVALVAHPFANPILNLGMLLFSRVLYGLLSSSISPVAQALQADLSEGNPSSATAMRLHSICLNLGRVGGILLLIVLRSQVQTALLAYLLWIAGVFVVSQTLRSFDLKSERSTSIRESKMAGTWKIQFQDVKWIVAIAFLFTCFVEALNSSLAISIKHLLQLDPFSTTQTTARVLLMASLGVVGVQFLGQVIPQLSMKNGLMLGLSSLFAGSLCFAGMRSESDLYVAMVLLVFGIGWMPPLYLTQLKKNCPEGHYGKRAGIVSSAHTLGFTCGGVLSALIYKVDRSSSGLLLSVLVLFLGWVSFKHCKENGEKYCNEEGIYETGSDRLLEKSH